MSWLLGLLILVVLAFFVGVPMLVFFTHRFPIQPEGQPIRLADLGDEEARRYLSRSAETLEREGFEAGEPMLYPGPTRSTFSVAMLMLHTMTEDCALISVTFSGNPQGASSKAMYTEFGTFFADGSAILTNNAPLASAFAPVASRDVLRCPGVVSLSLLFKIHRARVESSPKVNEPRLVPDEDAPEEFVPTMIQRELESQVGAGYMQRDDAAGVYRPTLKGAFLMVWAELPPMKQIRTTRESNRTAERLRLLGFDTSGAFA
jgi:hypothetical protein